MRALLTWLLIAGTGFGALAGGYHWHLQTEPRKLLVLVDSSFAMREAWPRMPQVLQSLEGKRYTRYALETDKAPVHDYAEHLDLGRSGTYAPRDFSRLLAQSERGAYSDADQIVLISNAAAAELAALPAWRVVRP